MNPRTLVGLLALGLAACDDGPNTPVDTRPLTLSEWALFVGTPADQTPAVGVVRYDVISELFSDYAIKRRFIRLPAGTRIDYDEDARWGFPVGTVLVKSFAFPVDERDPAAGETLVETRLIVHEPSGYRAYVYRWNAAQTEATLLDLGENASVSFIDAAGVARTEAYRVPSRFECNRCHRGVDEAFAPIGPRTRQLDRDVDHGAGSVNQIDHLASLGWLDQVPLAYDARRRMHAPFGLGGTLDERARSYLDSNCAHCHRAGGGASSTGLFLDFDEMDGLRLGVCKAPVAAGGGSGGLDVDIQPGEPDASVMVYRMNSLVPDEKMPELPNMRIHVEGVALVREWIAAMPTSTCP